MNIKIDVGSILTPEQLKEIASLLDPMTGSDSIRAFSIAAISESAEAILGRRSYSAAQTTQNRLHHLVTHAFGGKVPDEALVSRLFGITERKAVSLIETVANLHHADFEAGFKAAIEDAFANKKANEKNDGFAFSAPQSVVEYIKVLVAGLERGQLTQVRRDKTRAGVYEITTDTYNAVCTKLGIKA